MTTPHADTRVGVTCELPLLPLRDIIVFPATVVPLFVGRERSIEALEHAMKGNKEILLAAQKKAKTNDPEPSEIYEVGTIATILQLLRLPDGTLKVLVEGLRRARVADFLQTDRFYLVEAEELGEDYGEDLETEALLRTVKTSFDNYVKLNKRIPPEILISISQIESESKFSDTLVSHLSNLKLADKQALLEQTNPHKRLEDIYGYIQSEIEIMRVEKKIRARVKRQMEKTQKEYYLNEQMAAIQKELGDKDEMRAELQEMEQQIKDKKLSEEARTKLTRELKKLRQMSSMSAEATVVRTYLDTVLDLPWGECSEDIKDVDFAEKILERDHFGLARVKDRVLEYLSVCSLTEELKGPIICLVGPPGVGKTSLAKSIAESVGRKFVRIALGGVRDQAEIRGHRRTYIGSMPGKIIMALKKATTSNPLILLDEIDKMNADYRGDPASAMLEVLDPEQNKTFTDHYLDLDYDLSKCMFIATANTLDGIPQPLMDRMEVIRLAGYTEEEKTQIALRYLAPKQMKENGLNEQNITFHNTAIRELIHYYTREAGVRNLEREIGTVLRKVARRHIKKFAKDHVADSKTVESKKPAASKSKSEELIYAKIDLGDLKIAENITGKSVKRYLGPRRHRVGLQNQKNEVGTCTGLAWTPVGGEILTIEVVVLPGRGKLTVTGKLGDVMQESAQAAMSYVRSRADFLGLEEDFYKKIDIHIHIPEGAIPKDGPSAGLCMATALTSALTMRPVNKDIAMTGEITLRGHSLPIGGLKEKTLAAHRAGIRKVIIPLENKKDLEEIPKSVAKEIDFVTVEHMDEVLLHALSWDQRGANDEITDELFTKLAEITSSAGKPVELIAH